MTVSVPPRWVASDGSTVAHTAPPAAARPVGWFPTRMGRVAPVPGSILDTVPPTPLATQIAPSAYTIPAGVPPTSIVPTWPVRGLTRARVPLPSATQTLPPPTASPSGLWPTLTASEIRLSAGSTRSSSPVSWLVTQTAPWPAAIEAGALPREMVDTTSPVAASILDSVSLVTLATHTEPKPNATALGPIPTRIG